MDKLEFKNKKTKTIHERLLKNDKGNYQNFLNSSLPDLFYRGSNGINDSIKISFDSFQAIELYSRSNKKNIEKMFSNFVNLCEKGNKKYSLLRSMANENVEKIVEKVNDSYLALLTDFKIICNLKYISHVNMTLECMGPSLVKIIFNCTLTDFARYYYWMYACPNVPKELDIKRKIHFGKTTLNFIKTIGLQRKKNMLREHTIKIYKEISKYISSIAPGIFSNIYKKIPCTLIASYVAIPEYILTKNYSILIEQVDTSFFDNIINFNGNCERFVDNDSGNAFIPLKSDILSNDDIIMKYFGANSNLPSGMAWLNVIYFILRSQNTLIEMLKSAYYESDIYGKEIDIKQFKKKMRKISPLLKLIKSSYGSKVFSFDYLYETYNKYIYKIGDDYSIKFLDEYKKRIDYLLNSMEVEIASIKEIYYDNYNEINSKINIKLQWIAIFIAIITILQAFFQCQGNKRDNEIKHPHPQIEKDYSPIIINDANLTE
jgi:hypothetical protein